MRKSFRHLDGFSNEEKHLIPSPETSTVYQHLLDPLKICMVTLVTVS